MFKNSIFVFTIQLMCGSGLAYQWSSQWNQPTNPPTNSSQQTRNQSMTTRTAQYDCDKSSYFESIGDSYVSQEQVFCDELTLQETDQRLFAYGFKSNKRLALNQLGSYVAHMDQNGNEIFWRIGKINGGSCDGDLFFVESYNIPTKGWCESPFGVTDIRSTKTIYAIRGKCESTCFGQSTVKYTPGKRPKIST